MTRMSKTVKLVLAAVVAFAVVAGAGIWWFLRDDAPDEVDLAAAVESVAASDVDDTTGTAAGADPVAEDGIEGTWAVDTDTGTFNFEDSASGSYVGFRIAEELSSIGSTTAVGRTPEVTGEITIEGTTLTAATFEADMTAITTNESRRDSRVQSALETGQFPAAAFVLTEPVDVGAGADSGSAVSVTAVGDLTIHGVTRSVAIPLQAQRTGSTIVVVGQLDIVFADYDVQIPSSPVVVSVEDNGIVEVQLLFTRA
jgi:polyisoprenoid-binding protein YceI